MTAYEKPDFALTRLELIDWARQQTEYVARTLALAGQCTSCANFGNGHCRRWDTAVPEEHRSSGCDDWCIDLVPF